jgi:formate-dependent nitrite reductase membrane component NrfD
VAKCHYCAHRIDVGLEPACAVVCPTHAIIAGDLDDPESEIARTVARHRTTVRKPEQGTRPKVLYIEGEDVALHPTAAATPGPHMLFADVVGEQRNERRRSLPVLREGSNGGLTLRQPAQQGVPAGGPIRTAGSVAEHMVQVAYNAQHLIPWHWPVPAYLVTKGIGAGIFMFLCLGFGLGLFGYDATALAVGGLVALVATIATTALLVYDLERPERFLSILLRPQWRSWLARGAFLLVGFSAMATGWVGIAAAEALQWWSAPPQLHTAMTWLTLPLAIGAAVYTAFLFAQAEGRDLWQSPLLPVHLLVQALMMGSGTMLVIGNALSLDAAMVSLAMQTFAATLVIDLLMLLLGELGVPHASELAARAAHEIRSGRYSRRFWWGAVVVGHLVPLALMWPASAAATVVAVLAAIVGLYLYEHAFVMAPQEIPNS